MADNTLEIITTATQQLDAIASKFSDLSLLAPEEMSTFAGAMRLAIATRQLEEILTDKIMALLILPLKNKSYGFRTDENDRISKGKPPYSISDIRDVVIDGVMRGLHLGNNEFNIIKGVCFAAKNGVKGQCKRMQGLTDIVIEKGIPNILPGGAKVEMSASFKFKGKAMRLERKDKQAIAVPLGQGQGCDAALGKAERRMYAYIFETVTGSEQTVGDVDDLDESTLRTVATAVVVDADVSHTESEKPKQSQSQTMADKLKGAKVSVTKNGQTVNKTGVTTPPTDAPQDPPADDEGAVSNTTNTHMQPAASNPAPATGMSDASKALMAKAEKTLADAKAAGMQGIGANTPMIVDGKVNHRNLNEDGTLKVPSATSAAAPAGVPTTGTVVGEKRRPDGYKIVNGEKVAIYNDHPPKTEAPKTAAAPAQEKQKPVKQPAGAPAGSSIPTVTQPPPADGELKEDKTILASVQQTKVKVDGVEKIRFRLAGDNATIYIIGDLKDRPEPGRAIGIRANELKEKKLPVVILYYEVLGDYWVHDVQQFIQEEPAANPVEAASVTDEDLDNFGSAEDQQA